MGTTKTRNGGKGRNAGIVLFQLGLIITGRNGVIPAIFNSNLRNGVIPRAEYEVCRNDVIPGVNTLIPP